MNDREIPSWVLGSAVALFILVIASLWYRYLGPGSASPPPTRVEAADGGVSPKARAYMMEHQGR